MMFRGEEKHCVFRGDALRHEPQVQKVSAEQVERALQLLQGPFQMRHKND